MTSSPLDPGTGSPAQRRAATIQRAAAALADNLDRVIAAICAFLVLFMCVSTFLGVIYRYVLERPLDWPEEVARFMLVWLSLLAAARALRQGQYIALEFLVARLPGGARMVLRQVVNVAIVVFVAILAVQSAEYLDIVIPQRATATGISMMWPYLALAVSFTVIVVFAVIDFIDWGCTLVTGVAMSPAVASFEERLALLNPHLDEPGIVVPDLHENKEK
jgi:TRAP-type transport system small permease protein